MKQIKFRGRNIKTGIFHFGFYSEYPIGNGRIEYCITDKNLECWAVDPDSVAQFVGYDKNGKEIYSDDVVIFAGYSDDVTPPDKEDIFFESGDLVAIEDLILDYSSLGSKWNEFELYEVDER